MGVLDKLTSSLGLKSFSTSKARSKGNAGYVSEGQRLSVETSPVVAPVATYFLAGSAAVAVSGKAMKKVATLQADDKILTVDVVNGGAFVWATVELVEAMPVTSEQNTVALGLGESDSVIIDAEQVILMKDRHNKMHMQTVRRLTDSVVMYNAEDLQWRGNKAQDVKKIRGIRVVRDKPSEGGLYKIMVGSTDHALLVSDHPNSSILLVVNSTNSTLNAKTMAKFIPVEDTPMKIKNTFIEIDVEAQANKADGVEKKGIQRSYSDSDLQRLAVELEYDDERNVQMPVFSQDDLDLSSNTTSKTGKSRRTSSSNTSSLMRKSVASSESGGSISGVRVGTEPVATEGGLQTTIPTGEIKLSEYERLPLDQNGHRLSAASSIHQPGRKSKCRKCAYHNIFSIKKGRMCKNGALCDFCHDGHDRFIHRR